MQRAIALLVVSLVLVAAAVNVYATVAPELGSEQQAELVSGLVTLVFAFVVGIAFAAALGRESLQSLLTLSTKARQIERGDMDVELETNRNDELGEVYRSFAAMRDSLGERIRQTEQRGQVLQATAAEYGEVMERVGEGDLTQRLDEDVEVEAMADLARNFSRVMDQLEGTVDEVYAFTDRVIEATDTLEQQTDQSIRASAEVYRAASDMGPTGGNDVDPPPALGGVQVQAGKPLPTTDDTRVNVDETVEAIENLKERMDRIDETLEFISEVADETNMLALNAGIEASKVEGGDTEGFQVIAEEVKTLAEETRNATSEIETISTNIRNGTNEAVNDLLYQQAALASMMDDDVGDLADAARELRRLLAQLEISERRESTVTVEN